MSVPLRVCLVSAAYHPWPSGVSEHVHHLAGALRARGHEVAILTSSFPGGIPGTDEPGVTRLGRVLLLPGNGSFTTLPFGLRLATQVREFVRQGGFDVVHCHGFLWPETAHWAIMSSPVPVVVTFHTFNERTGRLTRWLLRRVLAPANRRLSARIAVTDAARRWAEAVMPGGYHVIPNGVDLERFTPDAHRPATLKPDGRTLLHVGRLEHRKGLPVLLAAMPALLPAVPDARLVVVGSGPLERSCRRQARELGIADRVDFTGHVAASELPGYYAHCDVFVSPALGGEAMGIVLVEAMAAGRPVVASDISGYNEVVQDGISGLLFPAGDAAALADRLAVLLNSERKRATLAAAARKHAAEYAWPRVAKSIEGVYREVIASAAR